MCYFLLQLEGVDVKYSDVAEGEKVKEDCCPGKPFVTFRTEVKIPTFWDQFFKSCKLVG